MKLTREVADKTLSAVIAMQEACAQICYKRGISVCGHLIRALDPANFIEKGNSIHLAKPFTESAVAPGECVSVPDERAAYKTWAEQEYHHSENFTQRDFYIGLHAWKARAGMQPPNNQPSLICKSCGVDRSKEDCKGDRLRCGLAGIAYSDHVAVISAKPDSVHLAVPTETATNTRVETAMKAAVYQNSDGFLFACQEHFQNPWAVLVSDVVEIPYVAAVPAITRPMGDINKLRAVNDDLVTACQRALSHYESIRGDKEDTALMSNLRRALRLAGAA